MNVPAVYLNNTVNFWMAMGSFVGGALVPTIVRIQTHISIPFTNIRLFFAPSVKAIYPMAIIVTVALKNSPGTSVSVSMPASSALVAQQCEAHAERLRTGTSYPMMRLARGRGPSNSELAEEESIEDNSEAKSEVIEIV